MAFLSKSKRKNEYLRNLSGVPFNIGPGAYDNSFNINK